MAAHRRTAYEIQSEFNDQLAALRSSSAGYDSGNLWESKRLATVAYTLLHDGTGRTKSLLGQLGIRTKIRYFDSVDEEHHHALKENKVKQYYPFSPLTILQIDVDTNKAIIAPRLGNGFAGQIKKLAPTFSVWWEGIVYIDDDGNRFSRKNLVFALRTQDGGAHFDPKI